MASDEENTRLSLYYDHISVDVAVECMRKWDIFSKLILAFLKQNGFR